MLINLIGIIFANRHIPIESSFPDTEFERQDRPLFPLSSESITASPLLQHPLLSLLLAILCEYAFIDG